MELKIGCKNNEVEQLQIMLNSLGYSCGIADGIYGSLTECAVNAYKTAKYINGVYDEITAAFLVRDYNKKLQEEIKDTDRVKKIRRFDSDVYIFETRPDEMVDIEIGQEGKLEPLSKITKEGKEIICKINGVFFNFGAKTVKDEVLGLFIDEGRIHNKNSDGYISFIYYKEGYTEIRYVDNPEDLMFLRSMAHWAIGVAGWSLIKHGQKDFTNSEKFSISRERHPRTLLAQRKNGEFVLVVIDGRIENNKGVTAEQSYEIMKELDSWNCVNLDGGYSSEMIYNNKIINDMVLQKGERSIGSAILVYRK